ncbi:MAG: hypothetical protein II401_07765 [Bacteroidales bacterium]|nr:hypothetical protein [Bacteroidales bacterium]
MELSKYLLDNPSSSFDILKHLVNALPQDQLIEIRNNTTNEDLWIYTNNLINPKPKKDTVKHVNAPLQQLLDEFTNSRGEQLKQTRRELQKRFDGQSYSDQEHIIETFMKKGTKTDVVWCSKYFVENYAETVVYQGQQFDVVGYMFWKDEYFDVIKRHWEHDMDNYKLLKAIVLFDSAEYLKERIRLIELEAPGIIDRPSYSSLLLKVCEDKSYQLPKARLAPPQYAYIAAKTGRNITPKEASAALVWAVNNESRWSFNYVRNLQGHLIFRDYKYSTLGLSLWSLSKLGYSDIIIAFNEWIKQVIAKLESLKEIDNNVIDKTIKEMISLL